MNHSYEQYLSFTTGSWGECENCGDQIDTDQDGYYEAWECPECMMTLCDGCQDYHECVNLDDETD